jgi:hypothetical protein
VTPKQETIDKDMENAGIKDKIKMVMMPLAKNSISVRLENTADQFDLGSSA